MAVVTSSARCEHSSGGLAKVSPIGADIHGADQRTDVVEPSQLLELAPDAMLIVDCRGTIMLVNAQAGVLFGYRRGELPGRPVEVLLPSLFCREQAYHRESAARLRPRRPGATIKLGGLRPDGSELPVEVTLNPVEISAGLLVSGVLRDITGRKTVGELALALAPSLMDSLPEVPGMQTASRYLPASGGVGGDWLDVVPLGPGHMGVLIGGVTGRDLQAVTVMGQMRSATSALARTGMPPRQLMDVLESLVYGLPGQLATCCYLVINASRGEVTAASAGHPPVMVVHPDGTVGQLPVPVSVPLGAGGVPHLQATLPAAPGSTLVLYTDGLVVPRCADPGTQVSLEGELRSAFRTTSRLDQAADRILASLLPDSRARADDVAFLLARVPAAPLTTVTTSLEPRPEKVAAGRRFVRGVLTSWHQAELADTASLLASEILTNAVRYARQAITLRLHRMPDEIITEVADDCTQLPRRQSPEPDDEFGRGLTLVEALARSWGILPADSGKIVWFTLAAEKHRDACRQAGRLPRASTRDAKSGNGSQPNRRPDRGYGSSDTEQARRCCWHCRSC